MFLVMSWYFHIAGAAGDDALEVDGIRVWATPWIRLDQEPVEVQAPGDSKRRFPVYAIATTERAVHVAAGEVSAGVYAFFTERPPALEVLWARSAFRASTSRTAVITSAVTATLLVAVGVVALWRDGGYWSAAILALAATAWVADCAWALRRLEPRWPWLLRVMLRLDS